MYRRFQDDSGKIIHQRMIRLFYVLLLATFLRPAPASVRAQQSGDILYLFEDFNDHQAQGWFLDDGCWFDEWEYNPLIHCYKHNSATYKSGDWGQRPFTLKFKFIRLSEGMHVNILTRDNPPGWNRYAVALGVDYGNPNNPQLHVNLFKQIVDPPPVESTIFGGVLDYDPYEWYQIFINYSYGRIQVVINPLSSGGYIKPGEPAVVNILLDYQDPQPLTSGGISFESINENDVFIDDVEVWGPPPAPPPQQPPTEQPPPQQPPTEQPPPQQPPTEWPPRAQPAFDYPQCPPGEYLFLAEDFERPLQPGWQLERGWRVLDERLQGETHTWAIFTGGNWKDYRLRMIAGLREGRNGLHINTRLSNGNRYFFGWMPDTFYLSKQMSEKYQDILRRDRAYDTSVWHSVEMSNFGSRVQIVIDGQVEIAWDDPNPLPPGTFGLETLDEGFFVAEALWVCGPRSEWTPTPSRVPTRTPTRTSIHTPTRTSTQHLPAIVPPVSPPPTDDQLPIDVIITGTILLVGMIILLRWLRRRPPRQPKEHSKPPAFPGLPPVRLINVWLTPGASGKGRPLKPEKSLKVGETYSLHIQLQAQGKKAKSQRINATASDIPLDAVVFTPQRDFALEGRVLPLSLHPTGDSSAGWRTIRPLRPGTSQVRVAVYYHNVLLQSAVLEIRVVPAKGRAAGLKPKQLAILRLVDYVAASRFAFMGELAQPALNIFTNESADGTHWIGLYSSNPQASPRLRQGDLHAFPADKLAALARRLRERLAKVEGERMYRMDYPLPPNNSALKDREQDLIDLAIEGFRLYDELFLSAPDGLRDDRLAEFQRLLHDRSIISIARCRSSGSTLPWAALYSFPIDPDQRSRLRLCPSFMDQVARTAWHEGRPASVLDHLDQPQVCLSQAGCPLHNGHAHLTICPFGFWGFMHQVEQPLQQVQPVPLDQAPTELDNPAFEQRAALELSPGGKVRLVMAAYPGLPEVEEHHQELASLRPVDVLEVTFETRRDSVLKLLQEGGRHLYYFYCHGVMEEGVFKLMLGPLENPGCISTAALDPFSIKWPDRPCPMIILNGCQTMALTPELIHGFMGKLRRLGASGLLGSEVKVWTPLARPFGTQLLQDILSGRSLGESVLNVRLNLLRQGNPLGLVYSLFAPANLHLHSGDHCPRCRQSQTFHSKQ